MDTLEAELSSAAGAPALQALLTCVRERAGKREAHEAEQGLFKRRRPSGVAAMQRSVAQRGTGDGGPAITRAAGVGVPRGSQVRRRHDGSLCGKGAVARTCDRAPGEPGGCPLDAPVNLPKRCSAYCLPEWMTWCAVEHPFQERASWFAPRFDLELAERVWMEVAQEAPADDEGC